jgi:hypothetical protein
MDSTTFDAIARTFGSTATRRTAVRGLFAGAVALVGGATMLEVEAKRRKTGKGRGKGQFLPTGALCQSDSQCNFREQQICEVPQNASNSDHRCCGAAGAVCGGVNADGDFIGPLCCVGEAGVRSFVCSQSDPNRPFVQGTCIPAPQED